MLWAYRTTKRSSIGETLFSMVCSTETVISVEIGLPTLHFKIADKSKISQNQLLLNLDLVEETR